MCTLWETDRVKRLVFSSRFPLSALDFFILFCFFHAPCDGVAAVLEHLICHLQKV